MRAAHRDKAGPPETHSDKPAKAEPRAPWAAHPDASSEIEEGTGRVRRADATAHTGKPVNLEERTQPIASTESDTGPVEEQDGQKAAGVLRLLEAGHLKGVADVRLRINFFDQLSAHAAAQAGPTAQSGAADLLETIKAQVDELLAPLADAEDTSAAIGELLEGFDSAVRGSVQQFVSEDGVNTESLSAAIQSAFDALVEELRSLLSPPDEAVGTDTDQDAGSPPDQAATTRQNIDRISSPMLAEAQQQAAQTTDAGADQPPADGGHDGAKASLDDALAALSGSFEEALSWLIESVKTVQRLPDPSPPSGQGSAYDKFLAMYNQLRDARTGVDQTG